MCKQIIPKARISANAFHISKASLEEVDVQISKRFSDVSQTTKIRKKTFSRANMHSVHDARRSQLNNNKARELPGCAEQTTSRKD